MTKVKAPLILHVETSHSVSSVALSHGEHLIDEKHSGSTKSHHQTLPVMIQSMLAHESDYGSIDAVHLCLGPGSYTGLRIGFSIVKGLVFGRGISLIGNSVHQILATNYIGSKTEKLMTPSIFVATPARPDEVYGQLFDQNGKPKSELYVQVLKDDELNHLRDLSFEGLTILGAASNNENFELPADCRRVECLPSASAMILSGLNKYKSDNFETLSTCKPLYLKPPRVNISKKKLLG